VNVLNSGSTLTAEGPIASCTVTVMGKKSWVPTSGHTNDYYTFEDFFTDLTRRTCGPTCRSARSTSGCRRPATSRRLRARRPRRCTKSGRASPDLAGRGADDRSVRRGGRRGLRRGVRYGTITSLNVTINGNVAQGEATIGSNTISDVQRGRIVVTGSFTAVFDAETLATRSTTRPRPRSSSCWPMPAPTRRTRWRS
jgi:hypothetical protein